MHIVGEPINIGAVQADIMIAADEYFVAIRQIAEPVKKVHCLPLFSDHAEISGVDHNVSFRQFPQPMMRSMCVREM